MDSLKHVKHEFTGPLTRIISQTLGTGIFFDLLKTAKVSPIYSKRNAGEFSNYRTVPVLPSVSKDSKTFERLKQSQIYEYFNEQNLLFLSRYGFHKNHSMELAALEIIDKTIKVNFQ